jgi:Tfp pilus assembly protein PilN
MPIRINLLAEAQAAEEMRRKDPVKRSIWVGSFLVFLVLLWGFSLQVKIMVTRSEMSALNVKWKSIEAKVQEINDHRNSTRQLEQKLSALDQFTTNRMLWANALNALQHIPAEGVQVVRVHSEQTFHVNEGTRAKTNKTSVIPARPATVTERINLEVEGRDYSPLPGDQVPKYKDFLAGHPYFEANLQRTNKVQLTSQSAPQSEAGRTYVAFGLQLSFEQKERRLYE